jgi:hypothetical protein
VFCFYEVGNRINENFFKGTLQICHNNTFHFTAPFIVQILVAVKVEKSTVKTAFKK